MVFPDSAPPELAWKAVASPVTQSNPGSRVPPKSNAEVCAGAPSYAKHVRKINPPSRPLQGLTTKETTLITEMFLKAFPPVGRAGTEMQTHCENKQSLGAGEAPAREEAWYLFPETSGPSRSDSRRFGMLVLESEGTGRA